MMMMMVAGRGRIWRPRQQRPTGWQQRRIAALIVREINERLGLNHWSDGEVVVVVMADCAQLQVGLAVLVAFDPLARLV